MSADSTPTALGPVQMMVLGFTEPDFTGKIAAELDRLREHDLVRVIDALAVHKDDDGEITALQVSDLTPDEEVWYAADAIPNGSAAAIVLLEHLWAVPLRNAIVNAGGVALADEWIHPSDLIEIGIEIGIESALP